MDTDTPVVPVAPMEPQPEVTMPAAPEVAPATEEPKTV